MRRSLLGGTFLHASILYLKGIAVLLYEVTRSRDKLAASMMCKKRPGNTPLNDVIIMPYLALASYGEWYSSRYLFEEEMVTGILCFDRLHSYVLLN
jgi:hypothetical protein